MKTFPRFLNRFPGRFLATSIAAVVVSGTVYAADALSTPSSDAKTIYEGVDAQGQIVRVTISNSNGMQPVVSSHAPQYPELNWTAHIGSGTAATIAH